MKNTFLLLNLAFACLFVFESSQAQSHSSSLAVVPVVTIPSADKRIYVGNPAEAYVEGSQVYLRDLRDWDLHKTALIGTILDPDIQAKLAASSVQDLGVSLDVLGRKLSDLQYMSPQLGHYVLAAINYYQWVLVDVPLAPVLGTGSSVQPATPPVPLANRFQNSIRVQRQLWNQMDEVNRVAMVIHEALSSFLKTDWQQSGPDQEEQRSDKVRNLVRQAFSDVGGDKYQMTPLMETWLSIPDHDYRSSCAYKAPRIEVSFENPLKAPIVLEEASSSGKRQALWDKICSWDDRMVTIRMEREPFLLVEVPYRTNSEGLIYEQTALRFDAVPGSWWKTTKQILFVSDYFCSMTLEADAASWFKYGANTLQGSSPISCLKE